jgi:heme exporter protein C
MPAPRRFLTRVYWTLLLAGFAAATARVFLATPVELTMGPIQKIFYLHLPVAINTFLACALSCVASVGYLWQRRLWWDDLAVAAARVAMLLCTIVLLTGMIWGKSAWGQWWTWSPRLTFSLVLWLLYVVYLMIRPSVASARRRAIISAVYGVIAFLDVPLVYLSVRLMPQDIHPSSITLAPAMRVTLLWWFACVTLLTAGLLSAGYRVAARRRAAHTPPAMAGPSPVLSAAGELA